MATSRDAILAACLQILGVSPTVNPDYDLTVRAALLRVLLSGLAIDGTGVISTTQPISVPINVSSATGTLAVGHGGTGLTTVAVNRLLYASALDTIAALVSANNGVLVTNGSGVPSISVTLPSGLTITAPIFSGSIGSDLLFTDATFDIGKTGATRPRDGFFSRNLTAGGTLGVTGTSALAAVTATTVTPSGLLDLSGAAAGQIAFPAAQNASAGVNTLDDYEEGTWTPVIGGSGGVSGQTYTSQIGYYQKIGKRVTVDFAATLSAKGTITTNVEIEGLPFPTQNVAGYRATGPVFFVGLATNFISILAMAVENVSVLALKGSAAANTTLGNLGTGDIGNTTAFYGTISYLTTN